MASVRFNLQGGNEKGKNIFLVYAYAPRKYLRYYVKHKIQDRYWDKRKHRAKSNYPNYITLNRLLQTIEEKAVDIQLEMRSDGQLISEDEFKEKLDLHLGLKFDHNRLSVFLDTYFTPESYVKIENRIRSYNKKLLTYQGDIDINDIDYRYFDLIKRVELENGNSNAYINKLLGYAKQVCKEADKRGIEVSDDYRHVELLKKHEVYKVYNTTDELHHLYNYQYSSDALYNSMLLYMLGAWTSLRRSDYFRLAEDPAKYVKRINDKDVIDITSQKVGKRTIIPLHDIVKEILEKREYRLISPQKLNKYIKEAQREAGIDNIITRMEYPGGRQVEMTYQKYELIATHTGRRSFITNAVIAGIPKNLIMGISGHSTETQLNNYVKQTMMEKYNQIADHQFFNYDTLGIAKK